MKEFIICMWKK